MATGIQKTKWNGDIIAVDSADNISNVASDATLTYSGKLTQEEILLHTRSAEIKEIWHGVTNHNRLYFGDNLSILAYLLKDPQVYGQVKLIYIDPPFATNKVYKSRQQVEAYSDTLTGTQYIEFLRRRLLLLHRLLSQDGSIYVHLDQKMVFHIKIIMDEIFGRKNFRSLITRKKCNPKNYTRKNYGNISDYILYYAKSERPIWHRAYIPWSEKRAATEYPYVEKNTGRHYKKVPIHAPGTRNGATGQSWRDMQPPPGKHWQYTPDRLDEFNARGEIYWSANGNPRRKVYLDQSHGVPVQDIWLDTRDAHNQMIKITGYPTEKTPDLLTRIIRASSNAGDLVLDCFAGSGTTLAVASKLGRRWIGIDNSSEALATILRRFVQGLKPMGDFVNSEETTTSLPLFDFTSVSAPQKINNQESEQNQIINDFTLYAVAAYSEQFKETIDPSIINLLENNSHKDKTGTG
ncbi:MAG: site-specific DNA-methyltransferase [Chloroflexota bacterium]|nr:site-specific DNA-methyltransferase [Chloroflexota bacterium]